MSSRLEEMIDRALLRKQAGGRSFERGQEYLDSDRVDRLHVEG